MSSNPHDFGDPNRQGQYPLPQWNASQPEDTAPAHYPPPSQYPVRQMMISFVFSPPHTLCLSDTFLGFPSTSPAVSPARPFSRHRDLWEISLRSVKSLSLLTQFFRSSILLPHTLLRRQIILTLHPRRNTRLPRTWPQFTRQILIAFRRPPVPIVAQKYTPRAHRHKLSIKLPLPGSGPRLLAVTVADAR